jgi:hypothetical protein
LFLLAMLRFVAVERHDLLLASPAVFPKTTFLDRASVRGLALLLPQDGIRGFGCPISLRVPRSEERSQGGVSDWPARLSRWRSFRMVPKPVSAMRRPEIPAAQDP